MKVLPSCYGRSGSVAAGLAVNSCSQHQNHVFIKENPSKKKSRQKKIPLFADAMPQAVSHLQQTASS